METREKILAAIEKVGTVMAFKKIAKVSDATVYKYRKNVGGIGPEAEGRMLNAANQILQDSWFDRNVIKKAEPVNQKHEDASRNILEMMMSEVEQEFEAPTPWEMLFRSMADLMSQDREFKKNKMIVNAMKNLGR